MCTKHPWWVNAFTVNLCSCTIDHDPFPEQQNSDVYRSWYVKVLFCYLSEELLHKQSQSYTREASLSRNRMFVRQDPTNFWNIHHRHIQSSVEVLSGLSVWNRFLGQYLYTNITRPLLNQFDHQPVFLQSMSSALWSVGFVWLLLVC